MACRYWQGDARDAPPGSFSSDGLAVTSRLCLCKILYTTQPQPHPVSENPEAKLFSDLQNTNTTDNRQPAAGRGGAAARKSRKQKAVPSSFFEGAALFLFPFAFLAPNRIRLKPPRTCL